jgi:predicted lipid-binding transport protein (Tim44 family)
MRRVGNLLGRTIHPAASSICTTQETVAPSNLARFHQVTLANTGILTYGMENASDMYPPYQPSLLGGFGSVVGSIMGALMIGLTNNGLTLMGLEFSQQLIARGVMIILAVTVARSRK